MVLSPAVETPVSRHIVPSGLGLSVGIGFDVVANVITEVDVMDGAGISMPGDNSDDG